MGEGIRVVDVRGDGIGDLSLCAIRNPAHEGYRRKTTWLDSHFPKGLRLKILVGEKGVQLGNIEYLPGEYAWRGVEASGYMFIHCLWTYSRKLKGTGLGSRLILSAAEDARKAGMKGVAALARKGPWLAGRSIFLKSGFQIVDTAPPDYQLLALKFDRDSPDPKFKRGWEKKLKSMGPGLTIVRADQCPHLAKFADDIAETARTAYKLHPKIVEIRNHREAQNAPTPYAVFSVLLDGRILADHPISATRFKNIMDRLTGNPRPRRGAPKAARRPSQ